MPWNTGSALGGAGTGAIYGASFGGPLGAAIGGVAGGLAGGFGGGKKKKPKQIDNFDPKQRELYNQYIQAIQGGGGPLADVFSQFNPQQMRDVYEKSYAQPAYQEFQENVVPTITGQFRGQNLQNSSYLGGALAKAGTGVQNNLNAQMAQMLYNGQQENLNRRQSGIQGILGQQTHSYEKPQPSIFDELLNSLAGGAGSLVANKFSSMSNPWSGQANTPMQVPQPQTAGVGG